MTLVRGLAILGAVRPAVAIAGLLLLGALMAWALGSRGRAPTARPGSARPSAAASGPGESLADRMLALESRVPVAVIASGTTIRGRIVDASSPALPLPGIPFHLLARSRLARLESEEDSIVARGISGGDGGFELTVESTDAYLALCEAAGFRPELVPLDAGVLNVLVLRPAAELTTLRGRVLDEAGDEVPGVSVTLQGVGVSAIAGAAPSREGGRFTLPFLQTPDRTTLDVIVAARGFRIGGSTLESTRGEVADLGAITLRRWEGSLGGIVVDRESGAPIAGASVEPIGYVLGRDGFRRWGHENGVTTGEAGTFVIGSISGEGVAALRASAPGYAEGRLDMAALDPRSVVVVALGRGGALEGRLIGPDGAPVRKRGIRCLPRDLPGDPVQVIEPFELLTSTDAGGLFRFPHLAEGEYELDVRTLDCDGDRDSYSARRLARVTEGRSEWIDLRVGDGVTVSAEVVLDPRFRPDAMIQAHLLDGTGWCAASTRMPAACGLRFLDVPPGDYELVVYPTSDRRFPHSGRISVQAGGTVLGPVDLREACRRFLDR